MVVNSCPGRAKVVVLGAGANYAGPLIYTIPDSMRSLGPGQRVLVPFRSRKLTGIVVEAGASVDDGAFELRPIIESLDSSPIFDRAHLDLISFAANYYLVPIEDAFRNIVPASLRVESGRRLSLAREPAPLELSAMNAVERKILSRLAKGSVASAALKHIGDNGAVAAAIRNLESYGLLEHRDFTHGRHRDNSDLHVRIRSDQDLAKPRGGRQVRIWQLLEEAGDSGMATSLLESEVPGAKTAVRQMLSRGLLELSETPPANEPSAGSAPELTDEQTAAFNVVAPAISEKRFSPFLLWGVTGSGKTEVYLRLTAAALESGRQALVLVPEIALADEVVRSFRARFGHVVAVAHSGQTVAERWSSWNQALSLRARIMIGPRSAIFAPLSDVGLVIVDEEHDASYKQEEGIRYNARDLAVVLAQFASAPIVLGSATPSAESWANCSGGRYRMLRLANRIHGRQLAAVEVIDLRRELAKRDQKPAKKDTATESPTPISPALIDALRANLDSQGQSIIFLNRRGFHNFLQCHLCGNVISCRNCSVAMTFHLRDRSLRCHYCGEHSGAPEACPGCGGLGLQGQGFGTERVASAIQQLLPSARIERMDSDTSRRRGARARMLSALRHREIDILVGTQMVTKGLDFPAVTLVGVILADLSLNMPDFRAAERTFQLLTQVAGRAGRGEHPGRVLIQTYAPHHYSIRAAADQDYVRFIRRELRLRREVSYPPYCRLVLIRFESADSVAVEKIASMAADELSRAAPADSIEVLGPAPSPIERIKNRFRWQLMVKSSSLTKLRESVAAARSRIHDLARARDVRLIVDVDPISML